MPSLEDAAYRPHWKTLACAGSFLEGAG